MADFANGIIMYLKLCHLLAPSSVLDSRIARGTVLKNVLNQSIENGVERAICGRIKAQ